MIGAMKSRRLRWASHVARMEVVRSASKLLTGKSTGNRYLRKPRRRFDGNFRMDIKEVGVNTRNWVGSAQNRNYCRALGI